MKSQSLLWLQRLIPNLAPWCSFHHHGALITHSPKPKTSDFSVTLVRQSLLNHSPTLKPSLILPCPDGPLPETAQFMADSPGLFPFSTPDLPSPPKKAQEPRLRTWPDFLGEEGKEQPSLRRRRLVWFDCGIQNASKVPRAKQGFRNGQVDAAQRSASSPLHSALEVVLNRACNNPPWSRVGLSAGGNYTNELPSRVACPSPTLTPPNPTSPGCHTGIHKLEICSPSLPPTFLKPSPPTYQKCWICSFSSSSFLSSFSSPA